ncbi:MAG: RsmB/NOP family class I SAM-dependent RNA methyltransferase, partial [Rhodospirillales bacterium]
MAEATAAPLPAGVAARSVALDLLQAVVRRGEALDDALSAAAGFAQLAVRDRAFVRLIVATGLRRLGQIDALIAHCVPRPLPARAAAAHDALRLAIAQLLFLRMPAHAVVDTAVALAAARGAAAQKGLVNAVLRRLTREGDGMVAGQDAPRLNTPDWLWTAWTTSFGGDTAHAIAAVHLAEPPLDLTCPADAADWATRLGAAALPTGTLRLAETAPVESLPGFAEGAWWVQDAAAALPARILAAAFPGGIVGRRIADLCAAPGGKAAQLAAAGARVTAVDRSPARLARVGANLARLRLAAEVVTADAAAWTPPEAFDAVLLDAPCSGTGTLRRHPDIARLKRPSDVSRLAGVQAALLQNAGRMVAPGGVLVYGVCSLQDAEGPDRVAAFLAANPDFMRDAVRPDAIGGL